MRCPCAATDQGIAVSRTTERSTTLPSAIRLYARHADAGQTEKSFNRALTLLGSREGCDLILASSKVHPSHAAIVRLGGGAYVCDLGGPGGTSVNGAIVRWSRIESGDELTIGPFSFVVEFDEEPTGLMAPETGFRVRDERSIGAVASDDPVLLIGRDVVCDVILHDRAIAPRHALVVWTCQGPVVRDLLGRSSVRVNGRAVNEDNLACGDSIGIGPFELIFETGQSAPGIFGSAPVSAEGSGRAAFDGRSEAVSTSRVFVPVAGAAPMSLLAGDPPGNGRDGQTPIIHESEVSDTSEEEALAFLLAEDPVLVDSDTARRKADRGRSQSSDAGAAGRRDDDSDAGLLAAPRIVGSDESPSVRIAPELRARIVAAQNALDERARKLRLQLDAERVRLKSCQSRLQGHAERLLELTNRRKTGSAPIGPEQQAHGGRGPMAETDEIDWVDPAQTAQMRDVNRPTGARQDETGDAGSDSIADGSGITTDVSSVTSETADLRAEVAALAALVRKERNEMHLADAQMEARRFEIERLRESIVRGREQLQAQEAQHEARVQTLRRGQIAIHEEREALAFRMRRLDAKDHGLQARIEEADRIGQELQCEAERLARAQDQYDDRLRELRSGLDAERHRLRVRQTELQTKAAELAKGARIKRRAIEQLVTTRQAELIKRETQLKATRTAIAEAGRVELEKTATELEQLLCVRLADVEAELSARQDHLDGWIKEVLDEVAPAAEPSSGSPARGAAPAALHVRQKRETFSIPGGPVSEAGQLATLEQELHGLHRAVLGLERGADLPAAAGHSTPRDPIDLTDPEINEPRWGRSLTARFDEKIASLRTGLLGLESSRDQIGIRRDMDLNFEEDAPAADAKQP